MISCKSIKLDCISLKEPSLNIETTELDINIPILRKIFSEYGVIKYIKSPDRTTKLGLRSDCLDG